jgi:hypothetical protein
MNRKADRILKHRLLHKYISLVREDLTAVYAREPWCPR